MSEETTPTTPEAVVTTPTPTQATGVSPEEFTALQAKYERAQKDLTKFRTRAEEVEAAQKSAEEERLKAAPLEERLKALEQERDELTKRATVAELTATVAGKVVDPAAAIRLWQDGDTIESFLARHPYMAPTTGPTPTRGAGSGAPDPRKAGNPANMSKEQIEDLQKRVLRGERVTLS